MAGNLFLAFGSNVGDRKRNIELALELITSGGEVKLEKLSSIYETKPYGLTDQPDFYNAVGKFNSSLGIEDLFVLIKETEFKIGRSRSGIRWGPRQIDVDILFYNNLIYKSESVVVPHREVLVRDFVIVPLLEIEPDFVHPVTGKKLSETDLAALQKNIKRVLKN